MGKGLASGLLLLAGIFFGSILYFSGDQQIGQYVVIGGFFMSIFIFGLNGKRGEQNET